MTTANNIKNDLKNIEDYAGKSFEIFRNLGIETETEIVYGETEPEMIDEIFQTIPEITVTEIVKRYEHLLIRFRNNKFVDVKRYID